MHTQRFTPPWERAYSPWEGASAPPLRASCPIVAVVGGFHGTVIAKLPGKALQVLPPGSCSSYLSDRRFAPSFPGDVLPPLIASTKPARQLLATCPARLAGEVQDAPPASGCSNSPRVALWGQQKAQPSPAWHELLMLNRLQPTGEIPA